MKLGDVTMVKDCMVCRREVILLARKNAKAEMPEKGSILPQVCPDCREKYLKEGLLMINPENADYLVIKDEAFKGLFPEADLKGHRIVFTEQRVIEAIRDKYKELHGELPTIENESDKDRETRKD